MFLSKKADIQPSKIEDGSDFDDDFTFENEKEKMVEKCPFGRFVRFNEELGSGAYKTVYRAYDNDSGCEVAWNVIRLHRSPSKEKKRISDEVHLLKSLKHPNFIHFISAWINKPKDEVVFITEIVTGGSLKNYLKKIKNPKLKVIKSWCREILQGLDYLHSMKPRPIIHRDLKCENIFINSNNGEIRIGDLGLATCMDASCAKSVIGTPQFMAPEMYEEAYGTGVDIYSFGMCLLEMVTQQIPYKECENAAQIYKKVLTGKKPQSIDLISNEELKAFILGCLKEKDERPSARELLQSRFLTQDDERNNSCVNIVFEPSISSVREDNCLDATRITAGYWENDSTSIDIEILPTENSASNTTIQRLLTAKANQFFMLPALTRDIKTPYQANKQEEEDPSKFTYEFNLVTMIKSQVYIDVKIESQELQYSKQKLIQVDKKKLTTETLFSEATRIFELRFFNPLLFEATAKFVESVKLNGVEKSSKVHNYNDTTTSTSCSTAVLTYTTKFHEIISNLSTEKGMSTPNQKDSTSYFRSSTFLNCYNQYLNLILTEYSRSETEDLMALRHNSELIELEKAHIIQKKLFLEHKAACVNKVQIPGFYDFNPTELQETPRDCIPIETDQISFSPMSSWFNFPDETAYNEENFTSLNNSVEMMSTVKRLSLQRQGISDELNKSNLLPTAEENAQKSSELSVPPKSHTQLIPITSANGTPEVNSLPFGGYLTNSELQGSSYTAFFSPINRQSSQARLKSDSSLHQNQAVTQTAPEKQNCASQQLCKPSNKSSKIELPNDLKQCQTISTSQINQKEAISQGRSISRSPISRTSIQGFNSGASKQSICVDRTESKCSTYQRKIAKFQSKKDRAGGSVLDKLELFRINSLSNQEDSAHDSKPMNEISKFKNMDEPKQNIPSPFISNENKNSAKRFQNEVKFFERCLRRDAFKDIKDDLAHQYKQLSGPQIEKIMKYEIQSSLQRDGQNINEEDIKIVQTCLSVIMDSTFEASGYFGYYTEKAVKSYQQKLGFIADGIITKKLWDMMKEDFDKKLMPPSQVRERELRELSNKALANKKLFKEEQIKDAQECLQKMQSEFANLSTL